MYTINSFVFGAVNYTVYRPKYPFQLRIRSDTVCTTHRLNLKLERMGLVSLRKDFRDCFRTSAKLIITTCIAFFITTSVNLKRAGTASRNIVMKKQYTLL